MVKFISKTPVDLHQYPVINPIRSEHITIGDLHANALKLIHILIQEQVIDLSPIAYEHFLNLYEITAHEMSDANLSTIITLIDSIDVIHPEIFICFIGDERADRGKNDLYIDLIFKKLHESGCHFEILLSNHGALGICQIEGLQSGQEFLNPTNDKELSVLEKQAQVYDKQIQELNVVLAEKFISVAHVPNLSQICELHQLRLDYFIKSFDPFSIHTEEEIAEFKHKWSHALEQYYDFIFKHRTEEGFTELQSLLDEHFLTHKILLQNKSKQVKISILISQRVSFKNLNTLIERGLFNLERVQDLYQQFYAPKLKLLSYRIDPYQKVLTIFSHAPCGTNTIQAIGKLFSIPVKTSSVTSFAKSIEAINEHFQEEYVKKHRIHQLITSSTASEPASLIFQFIWNRDYQAIERPSVISNYTVEFVHGHDSKEENRPAHVFNLNNTVGETCLDKGKSIHLHTGEEVILKSHKEYSLQEVIKLLQNDLLKVLSENSYELRKVFSDYQHDKQSFINFFERYWIEFKISSSLIAPEILNKQLNYLYKIIKMSREKDLSNQHSFFSTHIESRLKEMRAMICPAAAAAP
jgi:hypothetical protein